MSTSKRNAPATAVENQKLDKERAPKLEKTMDDLPPEVVTIILEQLTRNETRKTTLGYRLVNHQWKDILDSLIEKKIVSGMFPVSPAMKIVGTGRPWQYSQLHVRVNTNSTGFRAGENQFPFNSLLLTGSRSALDFHHNPDHPHIPMTLPVFLSTFGGNLTVFALQNQIIPINNLAAILGSMSSLKLLKLMDVRQPNSLIKPGAPALVEPPPLPNFVTLEVKASLMYGEFDERRNILHIWLIASYADQLVSLNLDTNGSLPPLQKRHQYSHPLPNGNQFAIATTSDAAFGKLKELTIARPSLEFVQLSETSALVNFSLRGFPQWSYADLPHFLRFIGRHGRTLETLFLDLHWYGLVGRITYTEFPSGIVIPKLKILKIHYPYEDLYEDVVMGKLLTLFPALEVLQFLYFRPHKFDKFFIKEENQVERNEVSVEEIVTLKVQLATLRQQMSGFERSYHETMQQPLAPARAAMEQEDMDQEPLRRMEWRMELKRLGNALTSVGNERAVIFNRLERLGEKRDKVVVEQTLERQGVWTRCANLKRVSVSSGAEPNGDVAVVRRTVNL